MKIQSTKQLIQHRIALIGAALAAAALITQSLMAATASAAGNDILYVTPASGSYAVGQNFTIEVRENSNSEQVNAVQVELGYSGNLQFVSIDQGGSSFDVDAQKTGGNGVVTIARGSKTPLTGDRLIAKVTFKANGAGTGTVEMKSSSVLLSHANNQNIVDTRSSGSFTLSTSANPSPPGPPGPPGPSGRPGPPGPAGRPQPIPTTNPVPRPTTGSSPNVAVTPNPTPTNPNPNPVILPDDSEYEVEDPSTITVTPSDDKEVEKVEYYINGKLVMTVNEAPFSYSVDTTNMRNGKYTLTTKTYYKDGKIDSTDAALVVKNPFGAKQLMLQLRHYAWLIILLLLLIGGLVWYFFFRGRGGDDFGDGYGTDYGAGGGGGYDPYAVPPTTPGAPTDPNAGNTGDPYAPRY